MELADSVKNRALAVLVGKRQKFLNFVRSRVRNREDAEEILQKVSLKVLSRGADLRDGARAEAWTYRILRNEIHDHYRRSAVEARRTADVQPDFPAVQASQGTVCPCAFEELSRLRPNYSEALRSLEMKGEAIASHAARTGVSLNNATVRLHRARKAVRSRLQKRCGKCAGAGCFDCNCAPNAVAR